MGEIQFMLTPCQRCEEKHSMLSKFLKEEAFKDLLEKYGNVCPSCLTEEEIVEIKTVRCTHFEELMKKPNTGGTGIGIGGILAQRILELEMYLIENR